MGYNNLSHYYQNNFNLVQFHKWSFTEIENMLPFERDIFIDMLVNHIREQEKRT